MRAEFMEIIKQVSLLGKTVRIVKDSGNLIVESNFSIAMPEQSEISKTERGWNFIGVTGTDQMNIATNIMHAFILSVGL
jgi:hypothetical protein